MTINVKYLSEQQIERDALGLLEAYFHELGQPIRIPIPADEILETHLGLTLDFDDLQTLLGVPDVLGAREKTRICKTNYWRRKMANGWTPERRARQAELIRQWRPWERSTGPKSVGGKAAVSQNAYKGGTWRMLRELSRALREQRNHLT